MKQTILITDLNKEKFIKEESLIIKYLGLVDLKEKIEADIDKVKEELNTLDYDSIGILDKNIRFTITKSKDKEKINYDKTLEGLNAKDFKKQKISFVWDDDKIISEVENVVTETIKSATIIKISELNKENN